MVFFDEYEQLENLSKLKDPLEKLNIKIDFELFRETLNKIYQKIVFLAFSLSYFETNVIRLQRSIDSMCY